MVQKRKYFTLAHVYGNHMPIHFEMQNYLVSAPKRLPTLRSSNLAWDTLNHVDEDIEFEDYLNDPSMSMRMVDLHARMEKRLGLHAVLPK
jgi:proteasome maturation protein